LLAFSFAQTWSKGFGLIVGVGFLRNKKRDVRRQILRGLYREFSSEWLPAVEWETMLARALTDVRRELRVVSLPNTGPPQQRAARPVS
jgi:ubiquinone biosynthesis protein Coq4